jgi:hypothetical protein
MNSLSFLTLPRITIGASALGTVALLCFSPFALPRVSPPEMHTGNVTGTGASVQHVSSTIPGRKLPKPSAAHRKAPRAMVVADVTPPPVPGT